MIAGARTARAALAASVSLSVSLAVCMLAAGCGDPALWARWQAQRSLFRTSALEHRLLARGAPPAAFDRIERRYRALLEEFPPDRWAPAAPDTGAASQVAMASGAAGLALARSEMRRGRSAAAAEDLLQLERSAARLPSILLAARLARHDALESAGRFDDALAERAAVAAMDPLADPDRAEPAQPLLDAPVQLASELRALGRREDAAAALRDADARLTAALARARGDALQPLALALGVVRAQRGDAAGALAPLRDRLKVSPAGVAGEWTQVMSARALEAGAPDTALVYARWTLRLDDSQRVAGLALLAAAEAWEQLGHGDSAIAAYDLALRHWSDPGVLGPTLRYRRALELEAMGQWDLARAEYLTLAATYPTHEYALMSGRRLVRHPLQLGQPELARLAGESFLANLDGMLTTNRDPQVQRAARAVRAELLVDLGRLPEAEDALLDQWRRFPADSAAQEAGYRAATLARHRPGGGPRADSILSALRRSAFSATVRKEAGAERAEPR